MKTLLLLLNRKLDAFPYPDTRETAGSVIMRTGKPVIAVPSPVPVFRAH